MVQTPSGDQERLAPHHIAILSRTKTNVQPMTDALLEAGIPFQLVGGVGFYDAPEVRDALAWLRLLADPFDSHAVVRVLQSPAIAASDQALASLAHGIEPDDTAFARRVLVDEFADLAADATEARDAAMMLRRMMDAIAPYAALPLLGAVDAVFDHTDMEHHYQSSTEVRAPQALANLEKLRALARGYAQENPGAHPADFVAFVHELERIDFDEREAHVPSPGAVTLSTIHSAKGLEWPIVFVLSVWPQLPSGERLFVAPDGALLYGEAADGSRPFHYLAFKGEADSNGYVVRDDDRPRQDEEERRLLYVAITRARDQLFLSGLRNKPSKGNPLGPPHKFLERIYNWLTGRGWKVDESLPEPAGTWTPPARPEMPRAPALNASAILPAQATLALPLSYSLIAKFEQCPRRATYRTIMRLPEVSSVRRRQRARRGWQELGMSDLAPDDSLLNEGDYGEVVHKALELWAIAKRLGGVHQTSQELVAAAATVLGFSLPSAQLASAAGALNNIAHELADWKPLHVEAPFTLDFGDEGKPALVCGYLDLLATDRDGRPCLIDYKTGGALSGKFELQLALYRMAAREAYGIDETQCFIGRVADSRFTLERIDPVDDATLRARILAVRDGLLAQEARPVPGAWCYTCGYRAAPCQDYQA